MPKLTYLGHSAFLVEGSKGKVVIDPFLTGNPLAKASKDSIRKLLEKRHASQPIGAWSCGSVFTNPPGGHAAELIERAGLKGYRIGGAAVSDKHANFIINDGEATAADLEALVRHVQTTVERVHGVRLVPEVRVVGEAA